MRSNTCWILFDKDIKVLSHLFFTHATCLHDGVHILVPEDWLAIAGAHDDDDHILETHSSVGEQGLVTDTGSQLLIKHDSTHNTSTVASTLTSHTHYTLRFAYILQ